MTGALTQVSNKHPFLRIALSWKPSLFPLGDSDIGHNTKKQMSFDFMAAVTVDSDFRDPDEKIYQYFQFSPSICDDAMGPDAMVLLLFACLFLFHI